jgi:predicted O-methyltransferase YrrM
MPPSPVTTTPEIYALLKGLHEKSLTQESTVDWRSLPAQCTDEFDSIMLDKFIALDQDKCEFIYHLLRSIDAKTVIEAGTSFGVSTIYLALAVAENAKRGGSPRVIATEKEASKAQVARAHWASAGKGVEDVIELRVGDLRETLTRDLANVDFLLLDSKLIAWFLLDSAYPDRMGFRCWA